MVEDQGRRRQWRADRAVGEVMRSPGRPPVSRVACRDFWRLVAEGFSSEQAAQAVGVSAAVGARWFRQGGGMAPMSLAEPAGRYLSLDEREEIAVLHAKGEGVRSIARAIGRSAATVSRELRRNAATRGGAVVYGASVAQWKAEQAARRPKETKLASNPRLGQYVVDALAGRVTDAHGQAVRGPEVPGWKGRGKPRRADRPWSRGWSPEQISNRLKVDFPSDESMRISHEPIYQALFIQGRGALEREMTACLRTGRALRKPRQRRRSKPQGHVTADTLIAQRPQEASDRSVVGHWEGDLIIGTGRSAVATLVERVSRMTILVHLPRTEREDLHQEPGRVRSRPSGYSADAVATALEEALSHLPLEMRKTITWDRGGQMAAHAALTAATGTKIYFADPHSPWQRPSNENTNGLLRQYFPKGTDLSRWSAQDLQAVAHTLNDRPRKILGWKNPNEVFNHHLHSLQHTRVATTA